MESKVLREKKPEELVRTLKDLRHEMADLTLKVRMGTSKEVAKLRQIRKTIARVLTIQHERSL
ncbi:MAG: 50S ribosomal protein L29 [Deltaproteobacteria bacterium]|nr:50S ribosomal protein L29 [Deltaproteobacteria bacterium]MBI2500805.1 50S ribosomal protein L29 [Deltaproteobacteria bacterium]MBI4196471.1 50S ribosomal protein L29 [Deltaproteobacteria bacterium]